MGKWQKIVDASERPWLIAFSNGAVSVISEDKAKVCRLSAADSATPDVIYMHPTGDDAYEVNWREALIISPEKWDADGLYTLHIEMMAKTNDSSQLHAITSLITHGICGPAIAHSFEARAIPDDQKKFPANAAAEEKLQRLKFSFERESDAVLFAAYIVGLSNDDRTFRIIDEP